MQCEVMVNLSNVNNEIPDQSAHPRSTVPRYVTALCSTKKKDGYHAQT